MLEQRVSEKHTEMAILACRQPPGTGPCPLINLNGGAAPPAPGVRGVPRKIQGAFCPGSAGRSPGGAGILQLLWGCGVKLGRLHFIAAIHVPAGFISIRPWDRTVGL